METPHEILLPLALVVRKKTIPAGPAKRRALYAELNWAKHSFAISLLSQHISGSEARPAALLCGPCDALLCRAPALPDAWAETATQPARRVARVLLVRSSAPRSWAADVRQLVTILPVVSEIHRCCRN